MFPDYERLVLEDYLQKRTDNKFPLSLSMPSPARLKEECERVCMERFERKDEAMIRAFFGKSGDKKECLKAIEECNINRFKSLVKYLRTGGVTNPEPENIELLAWLIDFKERPFVLGKRYISKEVDRPKITIIVPPDPPGGVVMEQPDHKPVGDVNVPGVSKPAQVPKSDGMGEEWAGSDKENTASVLTVLPAWRYWNAAVAGSLLLVAGIIGFVSWDNKQLSMSAALNGSCMYWAVDHYQPIPCHQKMPNTLVVALDSLLVRNFRKIMQPDTITNRAKGWVWYSKINNKLEFFTCDGEHPVVIGRRLKPITDYIIDKYIRQGFASGQ